MAVNVLLSATKKVVKMEHKKTKITMGFALLVCAVVALAGVSYALMGQAVINNQKADSDLIVVDLDKYNGFIEGTYTVDTLNNGTTVTLSNIQKNGGSAGSLYTDKYFQYSAGAFTLVTGESQGYSAVEAGSVEVTITEKTVSTGSKVDLTITGTQSAVVNQYGISFVWVYDGQVFDPSTGISNLDIHTGSVSVTLKAYVVYSNSVPHENIGSIGVFNLASANISFSASPTPASP